ncbi:MAG: hypothetical protein GF383_11310 [Candidatus Lokiarchaeota archaeon]|nr:hypothetical protein [Candidatus Lokiarchaeota archaeon]MBD3341303.1 hypothetical protein [Candidatus Lokiarchaeota archaeon]
MARKSQKDEKWHLLKKLRRSEIVEILLVLLFELGQRTIELNQAGTELAVELSNLLGVSPTSCIDPPWT